MSESPRRAAWDWVLREFDPRGYQDSLLAALEEVGRARLAERQAYRLKQQAETELAEIEADAEAPFLVDKTVPNAPAREKLARAALGRDPEVARARSWAKARAEEHDQAEAGFEAADRRFKALRTLGDLNAGILRFLGGL